VSPRVKSLRRLVRKLRTALVLTDFRAELFLRRNRVSRVFPKLVEKYPLLNVQGTLSFGRGCVVWSSRRDITVLYVPEGASIVCGEGVYINQGSALIGDAGQTIYVEDHAKIGNNCRILTNNYHAVEPGAAARKGDVRLGRNCWLGAGVTVLPGVTIGAHSVIMAGSTVARDVPPRTLFGGVPAKHLRDLAWPEGQSDDWVRT
jgi:acetyltransferase-like isoleucine patch superfamily enzyme